MNVTCEDLIIANEKNSRNAEEQAVMSPMQPL
jgi:hypothetical protein